MEQALEQYGKKSTTIGQMRQNIKDIKSPIYVACVDPPFKASFFKNNGVNETSGGVKYFWTVKAYQTWLENTTKSAMDIYMDMTYQLGLDWDISLIYQNGLVFVSILFLYVAPYLREQDITWVRFLSKWLLNGPLQLGFPYQKIYRISSYSCRGNYSFLNS